MLEHVVRQRVRALANVEVLHGTVTGLLASEDASRITGVSYAAGDGKVTGVSELAGDLVVDASGRGSKTPRLLKGLGYEPPAEQHVRAYYGYASQFVRPRGPLPYGLQGVITMPFSGQTTLRRWRRRAIR